MYIQTNLYNVNFVYMYKYYYSYIKHIILTLWNTSDRKQCKSTMQDKKVNKEYNIEVKFKHKI